MPRVRYPERIAESVDELRRQERALRGQPTEARVRLLRLLKAGEIRALTKAAEVVNISPRTATRWWQAYAARGLAGLLEQKPRRGPTSRLTEAAWADLAAAMERGEIATLRDAQRYLREHHQITYRSLNGIWLQLRRRRARKKTGRRQHRQSDPAAQAAYKRRLDDHGAGAGVPAVLGL